MSNPILNLITALTLATYPLSAFNNPIGDFVKVTGLTTAIASVIEEELKKQRKEVNKEESEIQKRIDNAVYVVNARHANEIAAKNAELSRTLETIKSLNEEIKELQTAKDACVNGKHGEIERLNTLLLEQNRTFDKIQAQLKADHEKREAEIRAEVQKELTAIAKGKHDWDIWKQADLSRHEQFKAQETQKYLANLENSKATIFETANAKAKTEIQKVVEGTQKAIALYQEALAKSRGEIDNLKEQARKYIMSLEGQINSLQEQVHQAQRLRYFTAKHGSVGLLGNKMINRLAAFKIYVDADHCEALQVKKEEKYLTWWFQLREDLEEVISVSQILSKKEDLKLALGLPQEEYDRYDLKLEVDEGAIQITAVTKADVSDIMSIYASDAKAVEIVNAEPYKIKKSLLGLHFGIFGQTGAGKSKLAGNIINFLRYYYKTIFGKELRYQLFDLKFPSTEWELDGKPMMPEWKNIEEYREGLLRMQTLLENRINAWADCEAKGLPKPEFEPFLFIIDESEEAYARLRDIFSKPVGYILRIGRALNVSVMIVGQSPNCKSYGFLKSQMFNMTRFWLGAMTLFSFRELGLPQELVKPMKLQIMARQAQADKELSDGQDPPPSQFYAVAAPPSLLPFVFDLPRPDEYNSFTKNDLEILPDPHSVKDVLREMVEEKARARLTAVDEPKRFEPNPNPITSAEMPLPVYNNPLQTNPNLTTIELMMIAEQEEAKSDFLSFNVGNGADMLTEPMQFVYDLLKTDDYIGWSVLRNKSRIRDWGQEKLETILKELISRGLVERGSSKAFRVRKIG